MPLLAQSGYGRGDKIEQGLEAGSIGGAILSPRDEAPHRVESFCTELRRRGPNAVILFDPQFYAAALQNARDGHLTEYDYYINNCGLSRNQFRPRQIEQYARQCLDYQVDRLEALDYLVAPSVPFDDFRDSWSQISLNMIEASIDDWSGRQQVPPLLGTVVMSEGSLRDSGRMSEFLDALSSLELAGFYLLVQRNTSTLQLAMEPPAMTNLLYFVYVLASLNEYAVVVGYSDWMGFLLQAIGATACASGWHNSLKQFTLGRFLPQTGGRRPRKRCSSLPLISNPLIVPELEDVYRVGLLPSVLSGSRFDNLLSDGPAQGETDWNDTVSCLAHWDSLSRLCASVESLRTVAARLDAAIARIRAARALYRRLEAADVHFEPQTGPDHLESWLEAIRAFRQEAGV